jgi:hypothetical protein
VLSILNYIKYILENENISDEDKLEQISELALPINHVKSNIMSSANPVAIHLAKILIYGCKKDWIEHIQKNLNSLTIGHKLKLKKQRYPTKEEFNKWIKEPIEDEDEANVIINKAIKEVEESKKRKLIDKKLRNISSLEFLNIWNKFIDKLSEIYVGNILFEYNDIEKIIKEVV